MALLLPAEIIEMIFDHLDREDLTNCRLVSKLWKIAAEIRLRETIKMYECTMDGMIRLRNIIHDSSNVSNIVKHIVITLGCRKKLPMHRRHGAYFDLVIWTLTHIFQNCRYIKTITGIDIRICKEIWSKILEAVRKGYLQKLQSLPKIPERLSDINNVYAPITWKLRSTVTKRELRSNSLEYRKLLEGDPRKVWLYDFTALEELTFYFGANFASTFPDCNYLIDICRKHQSLKSLVLKQVFHRSDELYQFHEQETTPCTKIKRLTVFPSKFLDEMPSLLYLIHKFPELEKLSIGCPDPLSSLREKLFNLLIDYISRIRQVQMFYTGNFFKLDDFLNHLLKRYNMTTSMVKVCALPKDCRTPWVQIDRSQSPSDSYIVKCYRSSQ